MVEHEAIAQQLETTLRQRGQTIATAESCTGGALAATLAALPGASDVLLGGVVAYNAAIKVALLGVPTAVITAEGVVSERCALAMAAGARRVCGADLAIATTGIAGPTGAEPGKPLGTVYIAVAWATGSICRRHQYAGPRATVIAAAVGDALALAQEVVAQSASVGSVG